MTFVELNEVHLLLCQYDKELAKKDSLIVELKKEIEGLKNDSQRRDQKS